MTEELKETQNEKVYADNLVSTKHSVTIKGKVIRYTATTGTMILTDDINGEDGIYQGVKQRAEFFFTAYTMDNVTDVRDRPLTFSFNGGPGSSSVWVHMGWIGPRRVEVDDDGQPTALPPRIIDNEYSILDMTDLVFIDPICTGYSRALPGGKETDFLAWQNDRKSVGDFIHQYVTKNNRWASPKYIAGESYGTTRAVSLSDYLADRYNLYLNGIILLSTALDFSLLWFYPGNEMPYVVHLPTYAADAHYHKCLIPKYQEMPLEEFLREVREFAGGEYLTALFKGDSISAEEKRFVAEKLAAYTGISADYYVRANLRVEIHHFCKELLRDRYQVIGRLDSRYVGVERNGNDQEMDEDPSSYQMKGVYAAALNDYLSRELGWKADRPYNISADVWSRWDYKEFTHRFMQLQEMMQKNMLRNRFMRVWVLNGYYDLATPFFQSEYFFNHINVGDEFRKNLSVTYYESGHMIYLHLPSLIKFRKDAEEFFNGK